MSLPKGYKRLEYIQSDGGQHLNTGFYPTNNTRFVLDVEVISGTDSAFFGARTAATTNAFNMFLSSTSGGRDDWRTSATNFNVTAGRWLLDKNKNVTAINGVTVATHTAGTFSAPVPLYILAINNNGSLTSHIKPTAKIYSCQMYENNVLVRDFIPCQNASGAVGLWDAVNEEFYANAGTGTFTAGPVVPEQVDESEITELEYIESSGTQYVDTLFIPNQDTRVVLKYGGVTESGWHEIFGSGQSVKTPSNNFVGVQSSENGVMVEYGSTYYTAPVTADGAVIDVNKNVYSINGVAVHTFTDSAFTAPYSMRIFDAATASEDYPIYSGKVYFGQIYDNGLLERDFVPAMLSNGEVGLYDRVYHEFYRNAGTGAFIPGNPVGTADITPIMTSNTTPEGYTASQSSAHGGLNAWYAFDGVDSTENNPSPVWHSTAGMPQWIMLQFPKAVKVTFFSVKNQGDVDSTYKRYGPTAFELQGSNDGATFDPLGAYTSDGALGETGLYQVQEPGKYQYYRVYVTEAGYVYSGQQYAVIDQIRFYEPLSLVPDVPANFRVEAETDTLVTLAWDLMEEVLGYRLYRQGQLLADTTETFVSVTVEPFAGAVFTLMAYNENGEGKGTSLTHYSIPENPLQYLITDRTAQDVSERNPKGYYAASDLNRVGYAMDYLANIIRGYGYTLEVHTKTDWTDEDWKLSGEMVKYLQSLNNLKAVFSTLVELPETMEKINYVDANNIEQLLLTIDETVARVVAGFTRANAFALRSGAKGLPVSQSDRGRNWGELDAMETTWANWQLATWYLLLYGNLKAEGVVE